MATITWKASYGLALKDLNFASLYYGSKYVRSSGTFAVHYDLDKLGYFRDEFRGSGFTYDAAGIPIAGTVKSYTFVLDGKALGIVSGIAAPVTSIVKAARSKSTSDDMAVYRLALAGDDTITGGRASDLLEGFAGKDKLQGGIGSDKLFGGAGADSFVYKSIRDSTVDFAGRDRIQDFSRSEKDKIDLSGIDANLERAGNQAFTFLGTGAFHQTKGELRYEKAGGQTHVYGDVNGDGVADFAVTSKGYVTLAKGDFFL
ncbi:M10 family metallopeptidase C-terminal domain-containing protein [Microvirga antarctica]|uniref:M10 family metallopeptidase C-terminal domain-containing protein n=1 Tax=Microvirga antarctica TaxID=2819233 RepID=UPI001FE4397E|nr:hypothetical protein [Microvirga antarctica]